MHRASCMHPLFAVTLILVSGRVTLAQPSYGISEQGNIVTSIPCGWSTPLPPVSFAASWKTTTVRKRADGAVITDIGLLKAAHDSVGRSYRETHLLRTSTENSPDRFFADVLDPTLNVSLHWSSDSKEAVIFHARRPVQETRPKPLSAAPTPPEHDCPQIRPEPPPSESPVEHLGPKMIHGIVATGTRFNSVIQPDQPGSEKALIHVIEESWSSAEYHVAVLHIVTYPNGDFTRTELTSFEDGAPDPALFEVPSEYTVRDVYQ